MSNLSDFLSLGDSGFLSQTKSEAISAIVEKIDEWKFLSDRRKGPSTLHYYYARVGSNVFIGDTEKSVSTRVESVYGEEPDYIIECGAVKYRSNTELFYLGTVLGLDGGVELRDALKENGDPVLQEKETLKSSLKATKAENERLKAALMESGIDLDALLASL